MMARFRPRLRALLGEGGAASVEMALITPLLAIPLMNVIDLGFYAHDYMEVKAAAASAVQAVWGACSSASALPATLNCASESSALTAGLQSTSLGSGVTTTSVTEGWYCVQTTGALYLVSAVSSTASTAPSCGSTPNASNNSANAGDYIKVSVSYSYTPVISGASVTGFMANPITSTAYYRLSGT
jgi:Flp pilus assembly protein TadG